MTPPNDAVFKERLGQIIQEGSEAALFLKAVLGWVHAIDDIEDEETTPEFRLRTHVMGVSVMSSNYYQRHAAQLYLPLLLVANNYADSLHLEKSGLSWKRSLADMLRCSSIYLLQAVILIEGGWEALRGISELIHENGYYLQHNEEGKPT